MKMEMWCFYNIFISLCSIFIDWIETHEECASLIFDKFFSNIFLFSRLLFQCSCFNIFLIETFFFYPIVFNEHLSPKYTTIKDEILTVHDSQMYSHLIYSTLTQSKYLVDKQRYLIHRDNSTNLKIQNALLFVITFERKSINVNTTSK
jgi:hypothetical protein